MAEKIFTNVRLGLKVDTLENWNSSSLVLKKGEVAFATIAASAGTGLSEPVCMMKIGDGSKTFSELGFDFYAKASDVVAAAKSEEALTSFVNNVISGAGIATDEAMTALAGRVTTAEGKITALEGLVGDTKVSTQISNAIDALKLADTYAAKSHTHTKADITDFDHTHAIADVTGLSDAIADAKKAGTDANTALGTYKATNDAAVKANADAITAINAADTGILAQAKSYADGKDSAIAAAKKAGDDAQSTINDYKTSNDARVKAVEDSIGTVPADKTVVEMISDAQTAATYDDTAVKASIKTNTDNIAAVKALVGDTAVSTQITNAIDEITPASIGAAASSHTHSGYASSSHTHNYAGSSSAGGSANSVTNSMTVQLNGGTTEGTNKFTFNGSAAKSVNITPSAIGAAASSHGTHVSYSSTNPVMDGTASVGSASTVARSDHKHPTDTTRAAASDLTSHTGNTSNPHKVTAAQVGADPSGSASSALASAKSYTDSEISEWVGDTTVSAQISSATVNKIDNIGVTTAGTGAAYTATVSSISALTAGVSFIMVPHTVSTSTTPTLNVNGLGAKTLKRRLSNMSTAKQAGYNTTWLAASVPFRVTYDGTDWIVEGQTKPAVADLYGTLAIDKGGTGATTAEQARINLGIQTPLEEVQNGVNALNDLVYGIQTFEYILDGVTIPAHRRADDTYYYILNDNEVTVAESDLVHDENGELKSYNDGGIYNDIDNITGSIEEIYTKVSNLDASETDIYNVIQDNSLIARKNARIKDNSLIITNDTVTEDIANLMNFLQLNSGSIVIRENGTDIVTIAKTVDDSGYMKVNGTSVLLAQESELSTIRMRSANGVGKLALVAGSDGHISIKEMI